MPDARTGCAPGRFAADARRAGRRACRFKSGNCRDAPKTSASLLLEITVGLSRSNHVILSIKSSNTLSRACPFSCLSLLFAFFMTSFLHLFLRAAERACPLPAVTQPNICVSGRAGASGPESAAGKSGSPPAHGRGHGFAKAGDGFAKYQSHGFARPERASGRSRICKRGYGKIGEKQRVGWVGSAGAGKPFAVTSGPPP